MSIFYGALRLTSLAWRRLLELDRPAPQRTEAEIEAEATRNYRWNFTFNLLDGVAFWFGYNFAAASTILPLFVSKLTPNPLIIGLVAMIAQSSWSLPQLFTAGPTERLARKKAVVVNLGLFVERLPIWLWPLAALAAPFSAVLALVLFFVGYAFHGLGAGAVAPAWQDLVARCFPVNRRGRFFGLTSFIGTGMGALGALFSSWLLANFLFPLSFLYAFLLAAVFITLSWVFLAFVREPVQAVKLHASANDHFWPRLVNIVRQDHNFRRYLGARACMALGGMGSGFVAIAAVQRWQVADSTVGFYTVALLVGQGLGNLFSGLLADRLGHKLSLEIGVMAGITGFVLAWLSPAAGWYYAVFLLLGACTGFIIVSGILITMEFSSPEQRPTYVGIANTAAGIVGMIAPLLGGWLASASYGSLFALSALFSLGGLLLLFWTVKEPRWEPPLDDILVRREGGC
jgi:MFS family permease